jgi:hypothetical protein
LEDRDEDSNFPVSYTRHRWFTKTWRTANVSSEHWAKLDRGASTPGITAFCCRFNNMYAGSVYLEGNTSDAWTSPAYSQYIVPDNVMMVHFPTVEQTLRWWRVYIDDQTNPDGFNEFGVFFLGAYFQPLRNYDYGEDVDRVDDSLRKKSEGGQKSSVQHGKYFKKSFGWSHITDAQKVLFDAVFDEVGYVKDFFFCEDSAGEYDKTKYVTFNVFKWKRGDAPDDWKLSIEVEESL